MKSFNTLFQPMLNYCRKFEDVILHIFADMTLQSRCIFLGTPGISLTWVGVNRDLSKHRYHLLNVDKITQNTVFTVFDKMNPLS